MELTGKLIEINPTQQITDTFKKREFVIEVIETAGDKEFTNYPKFQVTQNKCDILDSFFIGQEVKVSFNVKGNKWEKEGKTSYFVSLQAWKIEGTNSAPVEENNTPVPADNEDLPF